MSRWWRTLRMVAHNPNSPFSQSTSSYHTIQAVPRECTGSRVASKDRAQGRIPAVVLAPNLLDKSPENRPLSRKQLLTTETKQIQSILKSVELPFFYSTTFPLQIRAGSGSSVLLDSGKVLPIKVHRNEETGNILNLVFVWADDGTKLKVDVPVVFKGEENCPGLKKVLNCLFEPKRIRTSLKYLCPAELIPPKIEVDVTEKCCTLYCHCGSLNRIRTSLKYLCPAELIPPKIEVDVSNLDIGDRIFMDDVEVHPSLKLLSKNDAMPVCKIVATNLENPEPAVV
ncbi:hypothetical protein Patl1_28759 [Pistacia atlantica]|uniref:Uncharacterized protein n=1 Tax=Pistacia atlantica TaxID=434234 RepID=A0ACC1BEV9_9ROSI|nr:hypothetical protein Patl1_28759 [Pistacia atlantica]